MLFVSLILRSFISTFWFSPSRRSRIRNWIRLSERAHFSILISAFKMLPRGVKTGLDMVTSYFRKSKIHVLLEQHDDLFVHYSALRKFWCISCFKNENRSFAFAIYGRSPIFILNDFASPKFSWNFMGGKKTIYLLSLCYHHDNMRGNKYKIELWP